MKTLPGGVETGTGVTLDIETCCTKTRATRCRSATINQGLALFADTSNGGVLQAVSKVLAGMVYADINKTSRLALQLRSTALDAVVQAHCQVPQTGHA